MDRAFVDSIHNDLFRLYVRNHHFILPYLALPLLLIMATHIFLYGFPAQADVVVVVPVMALAGFSFCAQVRIQRQVIYPPRNISRQKRATHNRLMMAGLIVFKVLTLSSCLFLLFNLARLGSFNDLLLGYLVCSFLLIIYSSVSSVFPPVFFTEVATVSGFSMGCAFFNLQYHENYYIPFIIALIAIMALIIGIRNGKNSRMLLMQKAQLQDAVKAADAAQKAKSDFIATLSHEIRTPLNGIMGMIQFLREASLPQEQKESVDVIYNCSNTLLNTINDVLDLSKMEAGKFSIDKINFDIQHLLKSIHRLMEGRAREKNIQLILYIDEEVDKYIHADPHRIQQILMNLVSNAIKFTSHGSVTIHVSHKGKKSRFLRFEITDTGAGISAEVKDKLFKDYVQADSSISRKFGGTGLGLSIAKRLVTLMDGSIGVTSEIGKGSTFWFEIPYLSAQQSDLATREDAVLPHNAGDVRILVAEDNPINQIIISKFLKKHGFVFDIAHDGRQAVSMAVDYQYDMIFMDMQMPEMDGLEATRHIKQISEHYLHIPVIGLTGNVMGEHIEECRKAGMVDHISKPLDFHLLLQKMIHYLPQLSESHPGKHPAPASGDLLSELTALMGEAYVQEFIAEAHKNLVTIIDTAACAGEQNDREDIQRYIHDIKSISGSIGRKDMYDLAAEIEQMADRESDRAYEVMNKILDLKNLLGVQPNAPL